MARGSTQATGAATAAQGLSNTYAANANGLYGSLAPQLENEVAHPSGYSPSDLAAMNTAAQQSVGGANSGAVGQGSLLASRTKNAGTADAAIDAAARNAGQTLSQDALQTQEANANLKQKQTQAGLSGLESLYGTNAGDSISALGQVAPNVNANTQAENASYDWATDLFNPILNAAGRSVQPFKI